MPGSEFWKMHDRLAELHRALYEASGTPLVDRSISQPDSPQVSSVVNEIIGLLASNPSFALEEIELEDAIPGELVEFEQFRCLLPIEAFVEAGVSLEKIVELVAVNPAMIQPGRADSNATDHESILFYACGARHRVSVEDVVLIAKQWPELVSHRSETAGFPLCRALEKRGETMPLHAVRDFYDIFPGVMKRDPSNSSDGYPIQTALQHSSRVDVLRFLIQKFPKDENTFHLHGSFSEMDSNGVLGLAAVSELCSILAKIENLKLRIGFTEEALAYLLTQLCTNYSIKYLELSLNYERIFQNQQILNRLVALCHYNLVIKHIRLNNSSLSTYLWRRGEVVHNFAPILQAVTAGRGKHLEVHHMTMPSINWLADFLLQDRAPTSLCLSHPRFLGDITATASPQREDPIRSNLQFLQLSYPEPCSSASFNHLLLMLSKLPVLRKLALTSRGSEALEQEDRDSLAEYDQPIPEVPDLSGSLHSFLYGARAMESLSLNGFDFDHEKVCLALRQNVTLQTFLVAYSNMKVDRSADDVYADLLKSHNATLNLLHPELMANPTTFYNLNLNRAGRLDVRNLLTSLPQFVCNLVDNALLWNPPSKFGIFGNRNVFANSFADWRVLAPTSAFCVRGFGLEDPDTPLQRHSLLYGLLRESPGIWCGRGKSRAKPSKYWNPVLIQGVPAETASKSSLRWWNSCCSTAHVEGRLTLQRFSNKSPLFRISYEGKAMPDGGPAVGVLHLPVDENVEIKMSVGYAQSGAVSLGVHFSANSDGLDSLQITMPRSTWVQQQAAFLFLGAFRFADQERVSFSKDQD